MFKITACRFVKQKFQKKVYSLVKPEGLKLFGGFFIQVKS